MREVFYRGTGETTGWRSLVAVLFGVNVLNYLDRQVPFILIEEIKRDLVLSDAEMGLIGGLTFTLVYTLASLPLATLADRWSAKRVLICSLFVWCGLTAVSGQARSALQFAGARIGVALGEAGCTPASHALITQRVPVSRRPLAVAIFSLGIPIGGMLGLATGGWVGDVMGWRGTLLVLGMPGLLLVLLVAWFFPPSESKSSAQMRVDNVGALKSLLGHKLVQLLVSSVSIQGIAQTAVYSFAGAFLIRKYDLSMAQAGTGLGIANGVSGVLGLLVAGWLAGFNRRSLSLAGFAFLASGALILFACNAASLMSALVALALYNFCAVFYMPSVFSTLHGIAAEGQKAVASALIVTGVGLVGGSFGPVLAGILSDQLTPRYGDDALGIALGFASVPAAIAGVLMLFAARQGSAAARAG